MVGEISQPRKQNRTPKLSWPLPTIAKRDRAWEDNEYWSFQRTSETMKTSLHPLSEATYFI